MASFPPFNENILYNNIRLRDITDSYFKRFVDLTLPLSKNIIFSLQTYQPKTDCCLITITNEQLSFLCEKLQTFGKLETKSKDSTCCKGI